MIFGVINIRRWFRDGIQNKEHWNTIILDGTVPLDDINA